MHFLLHLPDGGCNLASAERRRALMELRVLVQDEPFFTKEGPLSERLVKKLF